MATKTVEIELDRRNLEDDASKTRPPTNQIHTTEEAGTPDVAEPEYPTVAALDFNVVATAIPAITNHFHTIADVGWYSAAYRLTSCAFQFMFGKLFNIFSIKRVFLVALLIFLIGSLLCAAATSSAMFVVGRAVCGLGCSGIFAGCFVSRAPSARPSEANILLHTVRVSQRPLYTSIFAFIETMAVAVAPVLAGALTENLSWRWCFWINLPLGGVTVIAIAIFMSNPVENASASMTWKQILNQLDLVGNLVFVPAITCLFMALSWAGVKYPWSDPKIIGLLVAFAVLVGAFIWIQHRQQDNATLPPRIIKQRSVIAAVIFSICCNSGLNVIEYYAPTYFQTVRGYSPTKSGYMMLPNIVGQSIGFIVCGSGTSMIGYYNPFMLLTSILSPIAAGLMTTWKVHSSLGQLIGYSGFFGFAGAIGFQGPQHAVQSTLPASDVPLGVAIILFVQNFGPAISISMAQTIFTNRLVTNLHHLVPGLDAKSVESMGFGDLRASIGEANLEKALLGFDESLTQTWYLAIGLACMTMVGSLLMEWRSVKQKTN